MHSGIRDFSACTSACVLAACVALLAPSPASANFNASNEGGGVSLETDAGTLSVVDGNTQMTGAMAAHLDTSLATPGGNIGDRSHGFELTAPASIGTTMTLDLSGIDFNADGNDTPADDWNTNTFSIPTVIPESDTALLLSMGLGMLGFVGRRRTP
jgi:hypothetical protein